MITTAFLSLILFIVARIVSMLPDASNFFPSSFDTFFNFIANSFANLLYLLAPQTATLIVTLMNLALQIFTIYLMWYLVTKLWSMIRG